jgi:hypothetical protein
VAHTDVTTAGVSGPETTVADRGRPIHPTVGKPTGVEIGTTTTVTVTVIGTETETGTTDLPGTEAIKSRNQGLGSLASQKTLGLVCKHRQRYPKRRWNRLRDTS